MVTIIAGIADFERKLIQERIRPASLWQRPRGKRVGRPDSGRNPIHRSDHGRLSYFSDGGV